MSSNKKYMSGNDKRKKKQNIEKLIRSQEGTLFKFFPISQQTETSSPNDNIQNEEHADLINEEEEEEPNQYSSGEHAY